MTWKHFLSKGTIPLIPLYSLYVSSPPSPLSPLLSPSPLPPSPLPSNQNLQYMDLSTNMQCQSGEQALKQLCTDSRDTTTSDPIAPYDATQTSATRQSDSISSPLPFPYFYNFFIFNHKHSKK
jgi:hypothetical protein